MKLRHIGAVLAPLGLVALTGTIIGLSGGSWGIRAFLNLEAFSFVVLGTGLFVWAAYPFASWRTREVAEYAAHCAVAAGVLGTLLGLILMLSDVVDFTEIPKRTALSLNALFFGLVLSRTFFLPRSRRSFE